MKRAPLSAWQVFADFFILVAMTFLLEVSLLIIIPQTVKTKDQDYHPKAEYLITLTWDDKRNIDLDLWLQTPDNQVVNFHNKEVHNINLDRDSRGFVTNRTILPGGKTIDSGNQEIITIRAVVPGDYVVAVHYYAGENSGYNNGPEDHSAWVEATVTLEKVNPHMTLLDRETVTFKQIAQAKNIMMFHIDDDGRVTIKETPPGNLVADHLGGATN